MTRAETRKQIIALVFLVMLCSSEAISVERAVRQARVLKAGIAMADRAEALAQTPSGLWGKSELAQLIGQAHSVLFVMDELGDNVQDSAYTKKLTTKLSLETANFKEALDRMKGFGGVDKAEMSSMEAMKSVAGDSSSEDIAGTAGISGQQLMKDFKEKMGRIQNHAGFMNFCRSWLSFVSTSGDSKLQAAVSDPKAQAALGTLENAGTRDALDAVHREVEEGGAADPGAVQTLQVASRSVAFTYEQAQQMRAAEKAADKGTDAGVVAEDFMRCAHPPTSDRADCAARRTKDDGACTFCDEGDVRASDTNSCVGHSSHCVGTSDVACSNAMCTNPAAKEMLCGDPETMDEMCPEPHCKPQCDGALIELAASVDANAAAKANAEAKARVEALTEAFSQHYAAVFAGDAAQMEYLGLSDARQLGKIFIALVISSTIVALIFIYFLIAIILVVGVVVGIAASIKLGLLNFRFKEIDNKHVGLLSASQTHLRAAAAAASILPAL